MIQFHYATMEDKPRIDQLLQNSGERGCEYTFTNLFAWSDPYQLQVAEVEGCLTAFMTGVIGPCYLYPVGGDSRSAVLALREDAAQRGEPFRLACLSKERKEELEGWFPGCFVFAEDRPGFDYLYDIQRLATLTGKKLHGKRNHINKFVSEHPVWEVEPITPANLTDCLKMNELWHQENEGYEGELTFEEDGEALKKCISHYDQMGLDGLLLRSEGGKVLAFTMGEPMGATDTYDVHFEKAFAEIPGAYPLINREFARWVQMRYPQIRYLNREDDMGVEGLRQAKKSYYPDLLLEKYSAVLQKELI